jgi:hypothetical protein
MPWAAASVLTAGYRRSRDYGCYSDNQFHLQMPSSSLAYNSGIVHAGQMLSRGSSRKASDFREEGLGELNCPDGCVVLDR